MITGNSELNEPVAAMTNAKGLLAEGIVAHPFKTDSGKYLYDTFSGRILHVGDLLHEVFTALIAPTPELRQRKLEAIIEARGDAAVLECVDRIVSTRSKGELLGRAPSRLRVAMDDADLSERNPKVLILELTQQCNFRCSYCVYSGDYDGQRSHSNEAMSGETAEAAIRRFLPAAPPRPILCFYGGEPLLRLDLILDSMRLARELRPECRFGITTNGYLLDADTFLAIRNYDPDIHISLDGPAEINDRNRVTAGKTQTFAVVYRNLKRIVDLDPDFARKHLYVHAVVADPDEVETLCAFFNGDPIFKVIQLSASMVGQVGLTEEGRRKWRRDMGSDPFAAARERYRIGILTGNLTDIIFERLLFSGGISRLLRRETTPIADEFTLNGPCGIGSSRTMVTTDGTLKLCEKASSLPPIGSVAEGITQEGADRMKADLLGTASPCLTCWAMRLCSLCQTSIYSGIDGTEVSVTQKRIECDRMRASVDASLRLYQSIHEVDPEAMPKQHEEYGLPLPSESGERKA
jgi:uncharacterized protein